MFPFPENGVSFKQPGSNITIETNIGEFPSPENGVSFKLGIVSFEIYDDLTICFRPLKTGLVSNYGDTKMAVKAAKGFRPLKTGLVSNYMNIIRETNKSNKVSVP